MQNDEAPRPVLQPQASVAGSFCAPQPIGVSGIKPAFRFVKSLPGDVFVG